MGNVAHSSSGINPHAANHADGQPDEIDVNDLAGLPLAIASGGTGQTTAQAAIDALTAVSGADEGDVLTKSGGNAVWAAPAAPAMINRQEYTSGSGNFTASYTGIHYLTMYAAGGGGGGGGRNGNASGGGGGAGGALIRVPVWMQSGASYAYSIGAKGVGGAGGINAVSAATNGTAGGDTTFTFQANASMAWCYGGGIRIWH